jgi:hypothetical protein
MRRDHPGDEAGECGCGDYNFPFKRTLADLTASLQAGMVVVAN